MSKVPENSPITEGFVKRFNKKYISNKRPSIVNNPRIIFRFLIPLKTQNTVNQKIWTNGKKKIAIKSKISIRRTIPNNKYVSREIELGVHGVHMPIHVNPIKR